MRFARHALVFLALFTCTRRAAPQSTPASSVSPADFPANWTTAGPGIRWRHTSVSDEGHVLDWIVVRFDLASVTPSAEHTPDDHLAGLALDRRVLFAVDAGFFTEDLHPSGTLVSRGIDLGAPDPHGGSGLLVIRSGHAEILGSSAPLVREPRVDLAVQCGPRLIERDGSVGIHRDDGRRFARTGLCLRDGGRTLDVVVNWWRDDPLHGPGLLGFAQRLAAPSPVGDHAGCESALNLDGGPSTGIYVRNAPAASHDAIGPVPFALTVHDAPHASH